MAKASPIVRSFNTGEVSALVEGRTDLDRYPASMRRLFNTIAAPQGPAIGRSGTAFVVPVNDNDEYSALVSFVFSNEQAKVLEFASDRIRFIDENGIQVYAGVTATVSSAAGAPIVFGSVSLGAEIGDQIVISGLPFPYNLNGEIANIVNKVGTTYTLDVSYPASVAVVDFVASRVYHVACTYTQAQREALRYVQSVDILYLLTNTKRPRKLSRYGDYDWRLEDIEFSDGPFMPINETNTTLTPAGTGNALPTMTTNTAPSGTAAGSTNRAVSSGSFGSPATFLGRQLSYPLVASEYYYAFDALDTTYWAPSTAQTGVIQYTPASSFACDGYTIFSALDNQDTSYLAKDYAPGTFTFEGYDGANWIVLDEQNDYVLYDGNKSVFFELKNTVSYSAYRLNITKCTRNGQIEPRVRRLVLRSAASSSFNLTASDIEGINNDRGFLSTDAGRLIRIKGSDNAWRAVEISTVVSSTVVTVTLKGEPLLNTKAIREWRMGYWSDTSGWPTVGDFFDDRLWLAGPDQFPDQFAASVVGDYENFSQTDTFGEVLDDNAIVGRLNSRKLSRIRWISSDDRGLLMGTGSEEYVVAAPDKAAMTARNTKARITTRRGSADVEPVRVDSQVVFVQRSGRTLREFAYVFEADGYKSPSMSQLATHIGAVPFAELDFAAEPHSIIWARRQNGTLVGLTYNRDENVVGWHQHTIAGGEADGLAGGVIESITVSPQADQLQDALWAVVRRTINGTTRRYIERLTRFWDFSTTLAEAHYVDSGLRYVGDPVQDVYGLQHLEGEVVYGLADSKPVGPLTVVNGGVRLPYAASNVVLGLGFESEAETSRLENGAEDGTAQGKVKRVNGIVVNVWSSAGGEVGVYNQEAGAPVYEPLEYPGRYDELEDVTLYTGMIGPFPPAPGYDERGSICFRRPKSSPLPFNILAIMPQMNTQDR